MRNKLGESILVFLTERCHYLTGMRQDLARELPAAAPSVLDHPQIIREEICIREQLPRCEDVRDRISLAHFEGKSLPDTLRGFLEDLQHVLSQHQATMEKREGPLEEALAKVAFGEILSLHRDLSEFVEDTLASTAQ